MNHGTNTHQIGIYFFCAFKFNHAVDRSTAAVGVTDGVLAVRDNAVFPLVCPLQSAAFCTTRPAYTFGQLVNNFVNLILTTSVCFSVTVMELMGASKIINGRVDRPFEIYMLLLLAYCCLTFLISMISKAVDKRISITL